MHGPWSFIKTTILGGLLFLLPFAVLILIVVKAGEIVIKAADPVAELLPYPKAVAIPIVYVAGLCLVALLCFAAGLFARSLNSGKVVAVLEDRVLSKFPPYTIIRDVSRNMAGIEDDSALKPVLVRGDYGSQIGLLVEAAVGGRATVFIPDSPNPSTGVVRIVKSEDILPVQVDLHDILKSLKKSGRGLHELTGQLPP